MRGVILCELLALAATVGLDGCGSCRKMTGASTAEPVSSGPATVVQATQPPPPEPPREEPSPSVPEPAAPREGTLVEQVLAKPASFWDLPLRKHVVLRATTERMMSVPREFRNPIEFPAMTLAVLDLESGEKTGDLFNAVVQRLYERLFEQKVFTAAAPMVAFWEPFRVTPNPRWSVAVPVADDTKVKPPLRLHRMPAIRVHAVRQSLKEARETVGSNVPEKTSLYEISRIYIECLRQKASLMAADGPVFVRMPDIRYWPTDPESVLEILFIEGGPAPAPAAPASH